MSKAIALALGALGAVSPALGQEPVRGEFVGQIVGDERATVSFDVYRTSEGEKRARIVIEGFWLRCDNGKTIRRSIAKHAYGFQEPRQFGGASEFTFFPFGQTSKLEIRGVLEPDREAHGFVDYEVIDDNRPDCSTTGPLDWRAKKQRLG